MSYQIKKVTTMKEIHGIVEIQRQAWGMSDLGIVPTFEMKAVASVGTVIVAVDVDDIPIGFIYAYDQIPDIHYSHMMAVLPKWQGKSIGYEMKKYHRYIAIKKGVKHIQWTVDPLLPNNAFLNFTKLGGVSNKYFVNYYGSPEFEDIEIYRGLDTDRFLLDWRIGDEIVNRRMIDFQSDRSSLEQLLRRSPVINSIVNDVPVSIEDIMLQTGSFSVEVPSNFQHLRNNYMDKAIIWRKFFREICLNYFNKGWHVIDYHSFNRTQNFYEFDKLD